MLISRASLLLSLLSSVSAVTSTGYGHFNGGSMSYTVILNNVTGKYEAHIDLITGWKLGKGPCGPSCKKTDVGKDTNSSRITYETSNHDMYYFGNWSTETGPPRALISEDVNIEIKQNIEEHVMAVSEIGEWEQEHMKTKIVLKPDGDKEDVVFEGLSWRDLPLQTPRSTSQLLPGQWHLQSKIDVRIRSDTGQPNASPRAYIKPFYRIKLDSINHITIPAIDPEEDFVKCKPSYHVEGGVLSVIPLPGLSVSEECTVTINTSLAFNYTDDMWGGIAVTVRDYNRAEIYLNGTKMIANTFALGGTTVQFLVQVLENLHQPEFVPPTKPSNHRFYLYTGTTWTVDLYAKGTVNTTIDDFIVLGRQGEKFSISNIKNYPSGGNRVKYATVSWKPQSSDVGSHIICVRAVDNTGVDSAEDRCFIIDVVEKEFHATNRSLDKPYFVDLPSYSETLRCNIDATCVFPIYVNSSAKIATINVEGTLDFISIGEITQVVHHGFLLYEGDLSLMHDADGPQNLCLTATDINGVSSEKACINSEIVSKDPCESAPCLNSAKCTRRVNDTADYECKCINDRQFEGKNCDKKEFHDCIPNPCVHGRCIQKQSGGHICYCKGSGYTGDTCSIDEKDCKPDSCNHSGICRDELKYFTCSCYDRYNGTNCENDLCPLIPKDQITCSSVSIPGCNPSPCNYGKCLPGGLCVCSLAYKSDATCSQAIGDLGTTQAQISIVPPTFEDKSDIVCYTNQICEIFLYIASPNSSSPSLRIETISEDLKNNVTIQQPAMQTILSGIQNLYLSEVDIYFGLEGHKFICLVASDKNSDEKRCFTLTIRKDPSTTRNTLEALQANREIKFVVPSPKAETRFVCFNNTQYHLLLYTTLPSSGKCETIIPTDDSAFVFDSNITSSGYCQTEITYKFETIGNQRICFQSAANLTQSQLRCFNFDVYDSDPCSNSPCQNNAECLHAGQGSSVNCGCLPGYSGDFCEKGPCLSSDNTCLNGYCYVDNHTVTCMCPIGFKGQVCGESLSGAIPDPYETGARFTDAARTLCVTCVRNRPCPMTFVSSGNFANSDKPNIVAGYVNPTISILDLFTDTIRSGSFLTSLVIQGRKTGVKDLCVQILNKYRVNQDEICIKITVTEERSFVWTDTNKPHFVSPSLPPNTDLTCVSTEPCHIILYAVPGSDASSAECVELKLTSDQHLLSHISSPCDNCSAIQSSKNCSFDLVMFPELKTEVCVTAMTSGLQKSGERRCYNVSVVPSLPVPGCQNLHCVNGGFCDGHGDTPICHCPLPYAGTNCSTDTSLSRSNGQETFIAGMGIPQIVKCYLNTPCEIPFGAVGPTPNASLGYVSPGLAVTSPNITVDPSTKQQTGSATVTPLLPGKHRYCMQMVSANTVDDELCIAVVVEAGSAESPDKTRPYFVQPTLPKDTSILCEAEKPCHLDLHFTPGSLFNSQNTCPTISDVSSDAGLPLHIYPSVKHFVDCTSDVSYIPSASSVGDDQLVCFEVDLPQKRGEKRCFNIHVVSDVKNEVSGPCVSKKCENGAKCIAEFPSNDADPPISNCVCTSGFMGNDCSQATSKTTDLPGVSGINGTTSPNYTSERTPHFDGNAGLPVSLTCEVNKPCFVNIPFLGQHNYPPIPGHIDSGLNFTGMTVLSKDNNSHVEILQITGQQAGNRSMCVQTTVAGEKPGENIDELCFTVTMLPSGSLTQQPSQELTNVPDNTTFSCKTDSVCHLMFFSNASNGCPSIRECGSGVPGAHIYTSISTTGQCVSDIAVKTNAQENEQDLCLASLSGNVEKHITLQSKTTPESSPCQKLHCKNGGFCDHTNSTAVCRCVNSYTGKACEIEPCTSPLPNIDRAFHANRTGYPDGFKVIYKCFNGYELADTTADGYTCVSRNNNWIGTQPQCIAKKNCINDSDCLNGGSCHSHKCQCQGRYNNTNCDTLVCSAPASIVHATVVTSQALYSEGSNVTYKCDPGYEPTSNSSLTYTCDATGDVWSGQGLLCVAKENCFNDSDCLNGGNCASHKCQCQGRYNNTNCDTLVCSEPGYIEHATVVTSPALYSESFNVTYACDPGYEPTFNSSVTFTCNATADVWSGQGLLCVAKENCFNESDCLNGGSCASHKCHCQGRYDNTNCDTLVCSAPAAIKHATVVTSPVLYRDGFNITYKCDPAYEPTSNSSLVYTCDATSDVWSGQGLLCVAKENCFNDSDCLNGGNCASHKCQCQGRYNNTNCDTLVCSTPPFIEHATSVTSPALYSDSFNLTYKCNPGYEPTSNSSLTYVCNATYDVWSGLGLVCVAKERCDSDADCLNGGKCTATICNCTSGFGNPNCDTEICDKPLPNLLHAKPQKANTMYTNGTEVLYACDNGYTTQSGRSNGVTCDTKANTWNGKLETCIALKFCSRNEDCLNGGSCNMPIQTCNCTVGYGNTNCDTVVCSAPASIKHATVVTSPALYRDGFNITYKCDPAYEPTSNSSLTYTCDATGNVWSGQGLLCVAKENCFNDSDCLNGGHCASHKCHCQGRYKNTNCDTLVCSTPPYIEHATSVTSPAFYSDGFNLTYKCNPGYEPTSNSSLTYVCNAAYDVWSGLGLVCVAKEHCDSDADCLNGGKCTATICNCTSGFGNSNCDTEICDKPLPNLLHAKPQKTKTMYTNGTDVLYVCNNGYATQSGLSNGVTCNTKENTWNGQLETCIALKFCSRNEDCLNGGSCNTSIQTCNCTVGYGNTNCDTVVCSAPSSIKHATVVTSPALYRDGFNITYKCDPGYEPTSNSSLVYTCDVTGDVWSGQGLLCVAKVNCFNDSDCLNGGNCASHKCQCRGRYNNTNCDTLVCSTPPFIEHTTSVTSPAFYSDGFNLTYKCNPGYEPTSNSSLTYVCNAAYDVWSGLGLVCVAKERCDSDADCLNGGKCTATICNCTSGFGNYNCDTEICDKPLPNLLHAKPHKTKTMYTNGTEVLYGCDNGYTTQSGRSNGVTCDTKANTWNGQLETCIAIKFCSRNEDCLNGGSCNMSIQTCNCTVGYGNTNCDTVVCSAPASIKHATVETSPALYSDGFNITYKCDPGYDATSNSSLVYTCDATGDVWSGQGLLCVAKENCFNDSDCLNGGHCASHKCQCQGRYKNTNCDTLVCSTPPFIEHATSVTSPAFYSDGFNLTYKCNPGYEPTSNSSLTYVCNAAYDVWSGLGLVCVAKEHCDSDADCLNGGKCTATICNCTSGFGNSNCDTEICDKPLPNLLHAKPQKTMYTNDTEVLYVCDNGYTTQSGLSNAVTCNTKENSWNGQLETCIALKFCSRTEDCLNGGSCNMSIQTCNCTVGYGNTNCDTEVCESPFPHVAHASPQPGNTLNSTGSMVNYTCHKGYTITKGTTNSVICNVSKNSWEGQLENCTAIINCTKNEDCINNGSCDIPSRQCKCSPGYGNTNCDTGPCTTTPDPIDHGNIVLNRTFNHGERVNVTCDYGYELQDSSQSYVTCDSMAQRWIGNPVCVKIPICSPTFPSIEHGLVDSSQNDLYVNGYALSVNCTPGYELAVAGSNSGVKCDATSDKWIVQSDTECIAKEHCDDSSDCIHGTCLTNHTCLCDEGYENTNCDTKVAIDTCDSKSGVAEARDAVQKGLASCYCKIKTPDGTETKRLQVIKRRPVVTMQQIVTAAGMGAGGMAGSLVIALVIYTVVKKVKRGTPTKRPLPAKSPRMIRVSPAK